eukprot:3721326-Amphidinium_carterae.2
MHCTVFGKVNQTNLLLLRVASRQVSSTDALASSCVPAVVLQHMLRYPWRERDVSQLSRKDGWLADARNGRRSSSNAAFLSSSGSATRPGSGVCVAEQKLPGRAFNCVLESDAAACSARMKFDRFAPVFEALLSVCWLAISWCDRCLTLLSGSVWFARHDVASP